MALDVERVLLRRGPGLSAHLPRVEAIVFDKGGVEAALAAKAAGQRHLGDGQLRVGQQLFGREQLAGEQVLKG